MPILHIRDEEGNFVPIPAIKGDDGKDGKDGKSAYEQAKEGGYTGTEEEFVDFLNGLTNSEIAAHCSDFDNPHKVTAEQAGAAPEQHNHSADAITSGTFDTGRLPIVPVSKGGTGAYTAETARANLGAAYTFIETAQAINTNWVETSTGMFLTNAQCDGLLESDTPILDVVTGDSLDDNKLFIEAWSHVVKAVASHGKIILYADSTPDVSFSFNIKVVR